MGYFLLCTALVAALYWVKLGMDDAIFWERKFKRVIQDFKDAETVEEFYQKNQTLYVMGVFYVVSYQLY